MDPKLREKLQEKLAGEYVIERELAHGGMSRVFVATECALGRHVVLKVLSSDVAASLSADRFKREIAMAARLQHPHIVPLLAAGQAGPWLYYTMPLVDGESLRERIDRERPMALADAAHILSEIAGALGYAHAEGVAHRDIKPENVMFFRGQAVVLDFGIGKAVTAALKQDESFPKFTTTASRPLGTPMYMAPEQATADADLDHRADLYALGVVAYEMITGHPPFAAKSTALLIEMHCKRAPDPIERRRAEVPKYLAAIVMRCLEKAPADRPSTGEEIVSAIERGASGRRSSLVGVKRFFARLPSWLPWAIAAVATMAAIVMGTLLGRAR